MSEHMYVCPDHTEPKDYPHQLDNCEVCDAIYTVLISYGLVKKHTVTTWQ